MELENGQEARSLMEPSKVQVGDAEDPTPRNNHGNG